MRHRAFADRREATHNIRAEISFAPRFVRARAFVLIFASRPSFVGNCNLGRLETPFAKRFDGMPSLDLFVPDEPNFFLSRPSRHMLAFARLIASRRFAGAADAFRASLQGRIHTIARFVLIRRDS